MVDLVLITEDKNDVCFLRDFIIKNYCDSNITISKKIKEKEYLLNVNTKKVLIRDTNKETDFSETGGWSKLQGLVGSDFFIKLKRSNENVNFVTLFDADEDKTDNISKKETDIQNWLENKEFSVNRFYLPFNNESSHNLEQLLELSFNKEIKECWDIFINCIVNNNNATEPTSKKGKIVIYKDIYSSLKNNKNEYLSEMWNLDINTNENLKPLKEFLDQYLN
jgi:hypothetical protein